MQLDLYTIHARGEALRTVTGAGPLAIIPPLWALWEGLWITFAVMVVALAVVGAFVPLGGGILWLGLIALAFGDGDSLARAELALRGWREVGVAQAASAEGAEELYLTGEAVRPS